MRYMADSTDCRQIPQSIRLPNRSVVPISLRCGYRGGSYERSSHACGSVDVDIDVDGTHSNTDVLDIELGDATPDSAPNWVINHNKVRSDYPAILYCNRSTIHAVANYLSNAGLQVVKDYRWWIATLDGTQTVGDMTGVTAVQVWGSNFFSSNIDVSIVYDDAWKQPIGVDMKSLVFALDKKDGVSVWVGDGIHRRHVENPNTLAGLQNIVTSKGGDASIIPLDDITVLGVPINN